MALTIGSGRRRQRVVVDVYTRNDCTLCQAAEELVAVEAKGTRIRRVDIDEDPNLVDRYGERVPVVAVDGREVGEGRIAEGVVRGAVRRAQERRWSDWRRA